MTLFTLLMIIALVLVLMAAINFPSSSLISLDWLGIAVFFMALLVQGHAFR